MYGILLKIITEKSIVKLLKLTDFLFFIVADERIAAVKMAADSAISSTSLLEPSSAANSSLTILSNTYIIKK